ncbi:MAG: biotin/lipoyl-binding protein [Synergistaceae bacterium]|nr:biotin/lipoyl-binding protein [Synergistaceae bacterium]
MAHSYRVSVNGKSYDVVVEEMGAAAAQAPAAAAPVVAAPAAAPAAVSAPAAAPKKAAAPAGGSQISSPMPGKIWKLHVREGDTVAEGQLVLVLEAMKMENEIFAPAGGKIVQVNCKEGDSVNTGDVLVVIG